MPSPGVPAPPRLPIEDSYFELLADTLESLDLPARGQFLQRYFRAIAHLDLHESQSVQIWEEIVARPCVLPPQRSASVATSSLYCSRKRTPLSRSHCAVASKRYLPRRSSRCSLPLL